MLCNDFFFKNSFKQIFTLIFNLSKDLLKVSCTAMYL